jgi:hypothetical protein
MGLVRDVRGVPRKGNTLRGQNEKLKMLQALAAVRYTL